MGSKLDFPLPLDENVNFEFPPILPRYTENSVAVKVSNLKTTVFEKFTLL